VKIVAHRATRAAGAASRTAQATPYQRARDAGRAALRDAVLKSAGNLLAAEGPGALTMRRIAELVGSSTTVLYSVFDGKFGIVDAVVAEGHKALLARLEEIPDELEAFERLAASGRAYREAGRADPALYQLMFGSTIPGYRQGGTARAAAQASFAALASIVQECIDAGVIEASADPRFVAEILIAAAHGAVSLELAGHFDDPARADERFAVLSAASVQPFLVGAS